MDNNNTGGRQLARREEQNKSDGDDSGPSWWAVGLGVAAGVATLAGGIYMLSQALEQPRLQLQAPPEQDNDDDSSENVEITADDTSDAVSRVAVSPTPSVSNLNSLLTDIHVRYIAIKKEDFALRYNVLHKVFNKLHKSMKAVDSYYERFSSRIQLRTEELNVYIVIGLPVNIYEDRRNPEESDIIIEPKHASFVQLRAGVQYKKILERDDYYINKQAYLWLDDRNYILRTKFCSWFQSVVERALKTFHKSVTIDDTVYRITTSASSNNGAYTLWITNSAGFRLEVDLVPTLKFPEDRWLGRSKAYRDIPDNSHVNYWTVIPKPNKFGATAHDEERSWQVDMYNQEKKFIHNSFHLRQGMRLLKKLRHSQQMTYIEDYDIESLFLYKSLEVTPLFWQSDLATIFKVMLREFYNALEEKKISFFWKKSHNLIQNVPDYIIKGYANKLRILVTELEDESNYMLAAQYLLTQPQYTEYKNLLDRWSFYK